MIQKPDENITDNALAQLDRLQREVRQDSNELSSASFVEGSNAAQAVLAAVEKLKRTINDSSG